FSMLWRDAVPTAKVVDDAGRGTAIMTVAGRFEDAQAPKPPPNSWAARPDSDVAIATISAEPGARWTLPAARPGSHRVLYVFAGGMTVGGRAVAAGHAVQLRPELPVALVGGATASEALLLQGRPIGE